MTLFATRGGDRVVAVLALAAFLAAAILPWSADHAGSALARAAADPRLAFVFAASAAAAIFAWRAMMRGAGFAAALVVVAAIAIAFGAGGSIEAVGWGAGITTSALVLVGAGAIASRGVFGGDRTIAGLVVGIGALLLLFIFYPVGKALLAAVYDGHGAFAPGVVLERVLARDIWSLACLAGQGYCGVAVNTAILATLAGSLCVLIGLVLALLVQRGGQRYSPLLRVMSVLPIVTPPFVVALAIIILFGRTGLVTSWLSAGFGVPRTRWIYGLPGVLLAQLLSFAPLAFMMLHGALAALAPSLEEAAQTLRADRARVFWTVTLPLLRPALANAFLLGFVESLADFANPLVLSGNFDVLSTKIFFAVAGAQHDPGRAAALAVILLALTLFAFWRQQVWLGRVSYATVGGKGDSGQAASLPTGLRRFCQIGGGLWIAFTAVAYLIVLVGGFVHDIGRGEMSLTFGHFITGFGVEWGGRGPFFVGSAWESFWTTVEVALISAPPTALLGLLAAYIIARHAFTGRRAFEFLTMVSFAIPGTVIGVAYIVAFNVAPFELTGGMLILVLCFLFRNLPVAVRAGIAALAQIDRSLDEASATLRASTARTLVKVILPLVRPAIVVALVLCFTHAMTAVSAVIFLATAKYNLATVYIVGRVEAGEYPLAIAYSTVLIFFMLAVILAVQRVVGEARLGRRSAAAIVAGGH